MPKSAQEISLDDIQKVMATIEIPSCPKIVTDTMQEAQKDDPDISVIARMIVADAGMSAAALKLANSAAFNRGNPVNSVRTAIERLGTKNIVCVVVASALRNTFVGIPEAWLDRFWRDTILTATVTYAIARRQYGISPDAAFTYALFHDAAIPLMARRFPNYLGMLDDCIKQQHLLIEAEEDLYPCTHPVVGSLLVKNWGLPPILGKAIRFHHDPEAYNLPDRTLPGGAISFIAITQVAEHICADASGDVDLEVGAPLFAQACDYLGLDADDLDELHQLAKATLERGV